MDAQHSAAEALKSLSLDSTPGHGGHCANGCGSLPAVATVVIAGGGLGGLAAALALLKKGIKVQVFDKADVRSGRVEGTLISLHPNGLQALQTIDPLLADKLLVRGAVPEAFLMVSPTGELLSQQSAPFNAEDFKPGGVSVRWSRILDALTELLPDDVLHLGWTFAGVTQDAEGVSVRFTKGSEEKVVKADLLIGADGIRSQVRETVFGTGQSRDLGRVAWRAVIPRSAVSHPVIRPCTSSMTVAEGMSGMISDPGEDQLYWALTLMDSAKDGQGKLRSKDGAEIKRRLQEIFSGWDLFTSVVEATDPEHILERRIMDLVPLDSWVKGRVVLLGDAAHAIPPALGQGANQSFEDALELARQLATNSDAQEALRKYEEERLPRVRGVVEQNNAMIKRSYEGKKPSSNDDFKAWLWKCERNAMPL